MQTRDILISQRERLSRDIEDLQNQIKVIDRAIADLGGSPVVKTDGRQVGVESLRTWTGKYIEANGPVLARDIWQEMLSQGKTWSKTTLTSQLSKMRAEGIIKLVDHQYSIV